MTVTPTVAANPTHLALPILILAVSVLVFAYSIYQFAHARLLQADLEELERLHAEGLLNNGASVIDDFITVSALLSDIAPAVYMRQEFWIRIYFCALRLIRFAARSSQAVETELSRLTAYQAAHYRVARGRMAAIRAQ